MPASHITRRLLARAAVPKWAWWRLDWSLRCYVGAVPLAMVVLIGYAASQTTWLRSDLLKFALLLGCALVSVVATPRNAYTKPGMVRDFITAWVLPVAILLPPVYAMIMPIPLYVLTQCLAPRPGVVYKRVFSAAAISLSYGAAALLFRVFPASFAGPSIGTGTHALTWTVAVAVCEIFGGRLNHLFIVGAIKLADPSVRLADLELNREALLGDFAEFDLAILITVVVAVNVVLAVFAVPTVLLARRFMMHAQLLEKSRIDTKTGLLNASTWETDATAEIARALRTRTPLSVALVDIDHFKVVNDTHGHLVGDKALRAVTDALRSQLRPYDLAGRFGGEEFAILLPHTHEANALTIAERLRLRIAALSIPVDDRAESSPRVRLTVSVGVAGLDATAAGLDRSVSGLDGGLAGLDRGVPGLDGSGPGLDGSGPGLDGSGAGLDRGVPGLDGSGPGLDGLSPGLDSRSPELNSLLAAADTALYYAKETGRNKSHAITASGIPPQMAQAVSAAAAATSAVPGPREA